MRGETLRLVGKLLYVARHSRHVAWRSYVQISSRSASGTFSRQMQHRNDRLGVRVGDLSSASRERLLRCRDSARPTAMGSERSLSTVATEATATTRVSPIPW